MTAAMNAMDKFAKRIGYAILRFYTPGCKDVSDFFAVGGSVVDLGRLVTWDKMLETPAEMIAQAKADWAKDKSSKETAVPQQETEEDVAL